MTPHPRFPRPVLAVIALLLAALILSGSISSAQAAPDDPPGMPVTAKVGSTVRVFLNDGSSFPVTVVRPGIAVFSGIRPASTIFIPDGDDAFQRHMGTVLDEIDRTPYGKRLLDAFADLHPQPDPTGTAPQFEFKDAVGQPYDINVVIYRGDVDFDGLKEAYRSFPMSFARSVDGNGSVGFVQASPDVLVRVVNGAGGNQWLSPDVAVFHELLHTAHALAGSTADGTTTFTAYDPTAKKFIDATVANEELETHGGAKGLMAVNGEGPDGPNGRLVAKASPYAEASIAAAVKRVGETTGDELAQAQRILAARTAVSDITEVGYSSARDLVIRLQYFDTTPLGKYPNYRLANPDDLGAYFDALRADRLVGAAPQRAGVQLNELSDPSAAACGGGSGVVSCDIAFRDPTDDEAARASSYDESVQAHGEPLVEPAAEGVIGELTPSELADFAASRVASDTGFTGDLAEAYRSGKVFVPTGEATASRLAEGWRFANSAAVGVNVVLWIKGLVEAFESDSSDLDRSTVALAMVPAVGQILGILDGLEHKDPASVVSNVTALLSFALDFVGQPELALVFGVVSFVTAIVDTFLSMDANDPRYQSYASWNIESRRDGVWKSQVAKGLLEKTIPALVKAAGAAFDQAQHQVLYAGLLAEASIDQSVARAGVADRNAAVAQKARVRAATQTSLEALRTGFVSGSQGVEAAIRTAVAKLNGGDGFGDFTHAYLQQVERPDYILAMRTGCQNGDSQTDDIPDEAQVLGCAARDPYYADHFDNVVEPGIHATSAPGGLAAQTYVDAVDSEIAKEGVFKELTVTDTDPALVAGGAEAPIASELSGVCLSDRGAGSQATTVQPGSCSANGWTVNPDHTITSAAHLCLDAAGQATSPGTPVTTWRCNGQANQRWTLHGNGTITGDQSGLCLDIRWGVRDAGAPVELWGCNGQANQRWSYQAAPYAYSTINSTVAGGKALTATDGGGIVLTPADGNAAADQQWTFVTGDSSSQPWGLLRNGYDDTCLAATSATTLHEAACDPTDNSQQWQLQPSAGDFPGSADGGSLIASFQYDDHCIDAPDRPDQSGPAVLGACSRANPQWRITPNLANVPGEHAHATVPAPTGPSGNGAE